MELSSCLFTGTDLEQCQLHPLGLGLAAVFTARAPDSKDINEDSCAVIGYGDGRGILVVADGAGGLPGGDQASSITVNALRASLSEGLENQLELRFAILNGIERANEAVQKLGIGAATTLAIAEIQDNKLRTYHVGDSQIMVIGPRGKVKLKTMSHSPVGYAMEAGYIDEQQAMMHEELHLVSNLIGFNSMHIEIGIPLELAPRDTVIVASDGLFDNLRNAEIAENCCSGDLLASSQNLILACRQRMTHFKEGEPSKPDDLTFIAFRRLGHSQKSKRTKSSTDNSDLNEGSVSQAAEPA